MKPTVSILYHIYYSLQENELDHLLNSLKKDFDVRLQCSIVRNSPDRFIITDRLQTLNLPCEIKFVENKGKDIGGKLCLIDSLLTAEEYPEYIVFLHDKRSPQVIDGEKWRKSLFGFLQPENRLALSNAFSDPANGIVCSSNAIQPVRRDTLAHSFGSPNAYNATIDHAKRFEILPQNLDFVGGTMFMARTEPYIDFFTKHAPYKIWTSLENGNILDLNNISTTHIWERLFSWISTVKSQRIVGI